MTTRRTDKFTYHLTSDEYVRLTRLPSHQTRTDMTVDEKVALIYSLPCPYCGVGRNARCTTKTGNDARSPHGMRSWPIYAAHSLGWADGFDAGKEVGARRGR